MYAIYVVLVSVVAFWFLQDIDDKKAEREHRPRASVGQRAMMFFFIAVVAAACLHWAGVGGGWSKTAAQGGATEAAATIAGKTLEAQMVRNIPEDIRVGVAPF